MIKFTRHAKNRIRRTEISIEEIIKAIDNPDDESIDALGRKVFWKETAKGRLKIVCMEQKDELTIITVILRMRRGEK